MADKVINYTLPAKQQFFALLNSVATETLSESDVTLSAPRAGAGDRNTDIDVAINRLVIRNPKELSYDRVAIDDVFALQDEVTIREIDLGLVGQFPDIDGQFVNEFQSKYGFKLHAADFDITKPDNYTVDIAAIDGNLAYTGGIQVRIEKSLATRIPNTILNGFSDSQLELS